MSQTISWKNRTLDLKWGAWKRAWPDNRREILEKLVKNGTDEVNFQAYQELAGRFVRHSDPKSIIPYGN